MISCTEFIPAYSEGFKFLETTGGSEEPAKFWTWLSSSYLSDSLDRLIRDEGLEGCFIYWKHSLIEEAADFRMTLNEIEGEFSIEMYKCPSKAILNGLKHIVPYHSYCSHCAALYRPVALKHGYAYNEYLEDCDKSTCRLSISLNK